MQFQNGFNEVAIELSGVQFWSEIILAISSFKFQVSSFKFQVYYVFQGFKSELTLRTRSILKSRLWFQTKLHSTEFTELCTSQIEA